MYSRTSFIYKYKTSTLTPFVKPRNILNLAVQNVLYKQPNRESAFTYNLGSTKVPKFASPWEYPDFKCLIELSGQIVQHILSHNGVVRERSGV